MTPMKVVYVHYLFKSSIPTTKETGKDNRTLINTKSSNLIEEKY